MDKSAFCLLTGLLEVETTGYLLVQNCQQPTIWSFIRCLVKDTPSDDSSDTHPSIRTLLNEPDTMSIPRSDHADDRNSAPSIFVQIESCSILQIDLKFALPLELCKSLKPCSISSHSSAESFVRLILSWLVCII